MSIGLNRLTLVRNTSKQKTIKTEQEAEAVAPPLRPLASLRDSLAVLLSAGEFGSGHRSSDDRASAPVAFECCDAGLPPQLLIEIVC